MTIEMNKQTASTPTPGTETQTQTTPAANTQTAAPTNPASPSTTATAQTIQNALTRSTLPEGYLSNGSMLDKDGVMLTEYLEKYPQALAQSLKPLSATSFQRAFLTKAKEANKKKVPYSAKKNCAQGMVITALKLVKRTKDPAPQILLDMIRAASATVADDSTFNTLYMHLDAVYTYMLME